MKEYYSSPDDRDLLASERLGSFEELWNRRAPWFETPNTGRSAHGWSGVSRIQIGGRDFFLKKQENFFTYSARFPFRRLLAQREFDNIRLFDSLNIPSLDVIYFGARKRGGRHQAIILTEALEGYIPLSEVEERWREERREDDAGRRTLIASVASLVRQAHERGLLHNSLYPKHIFVHEALCNKGELSPNKPNCRFIDLEKARKVSVGGKRQLRDIESLHRRSSYWSESDRLFFVLSYLGKKDCDAEARDFIRRVQSVSKH